jgi:hypothetical protein
MSAQVRSASVASSCITASAHSDDGHDGDIHEQIDIPDSTEYVEAMNASASAMAGQRTVAQHYNDRPDVGFFSVVQGNWGGNKIPKTQAHIDQDLLRTPAVLIMLQEAQSEHIERLNSSALAESPCPEALRRGQSGERPAAKFISVRGSETGPSLLIAGRATTFRGMRLLHWQRLKDGKYHAKETSKTSRHAYSRILVVGLVLKRPTFGMKCVAVCNAHMHHSTAKKQSGQGFSASHKVFFDTLASAMAVHQVRILAGDFNMSMWIVCEELRTRGLQVDIAAWYAFKDELKNCVASDSCGIWIVKGRSCNPLLGAGIFTDPEPVLQSFNKGQGFSLDSYLPKHGALGAVNRSLAAAALAARDNKCVGWDWLPNARETRMQSNMFDPEGILYRGGCHFPLLVYIGFQGFRSNDAMVKREAKRQARKGKSKGKGSVGPRDGGWSGPNPRWSSYDPSAGARDGGPTWSAGARDGGPVGGAWPLPTPTPSPRGHAGAWGSGGAVSNAWDQTPWVSQPGSAPQAWSASSWQAAAASGPDTWAAGGSWSTGRGQWN